jgi:hypothetical protein
MLHLVWITHLMMKPMAGELTLSVDEMTGIQALDRIAPDLPMAPGKPQAREFEYQRHGTQTLIAGFNLATGEVIGHCVDTRTEADFADFITELVEQHPEYELIILSPIN